VLSDLDNSRVILDVCSSYVFTNTMQSDLDNSKVILDVCSSCAFNYTVQSDLGNNIVILDVCSGCIIMIDYYLNKLYHLVKGYYREK
jgi:hypothetical protein